MTRPAQRGFTLIELIAAIALLAVTFFIVMGGIGQATHALFNDQRATRLALTARSLFDDSERTRLQPGTQQGRLEDGTTWRLDTAPADTGAHVQLYRLDLTLQAGKRIEHFSTLRAQLISEAAR